MSYSLIVFDWDGTLIDSAGTIVECIREASRGMGLEAPASRGRLLAVATGKSRRGLERALEASGLKDRFTATRCADETNPKPHPAMLLELMRELDVAPERSLMVGDTSHDLEMAKGAGVDALAVSYGAHPEPALRALGPRECVASVEALRAWLEANA